MTPPMDPEDLLNYRPTPEEWIRDFADLVIVGSAAGLDLGDLISAGLASAAEELRGVSHIVNGRPGSWESDLLLRLAAGKLGPNSGDMDVQPIGRPDLRH